jgi:Zn-dependent protease
LLDTLEILPILLLSVIVHEIAHGWTALRCGDPTAKMMGRLTLNPIPHIDLFGSIIVPLFSLLSTGRVFIAWAKPVPVNPLNFRRYSRDDILVSVAGPISNLLMGLFCTLCVLLLVGVQALREPASPSIAGDILEYLVRALHQGIYLNVILALFNLIPVPPLDGSHVVASLLPPGVGEGYQRIGFLGIFLILLLMNNLVISKIFFTVVTLVAAPMEIVIQVFESAAQHL